MDRKGVLGGSPMRLIVLTVILGLLAVILMWGGVSEIGNKLNFISGKTECGKEGGSDHMTACSNSDLVTEDARSMTFGGCPPKGNVKKYLTEEKGIDEGVVETYEKCYELEKCSDIKDKEKLSDENENAVPRQPACFSEGCDEEERGFSGVVDKEECINYAENCKKSEGCCCVLGEDRGTVNPEDSRETNNGGESEEDQTDAQGDCDGCLGDNCRENSDCKSGFCNQETDKCNDNPCNNGQKDLNNDETGVDCGGSNCPPCGKGEECIKDSDCKSGYVCDGVMLECVKVNCNNNEEDTDTGEVEVDCGGPCKACKCVITSEKGFDYYKNCDPCERSEILEYISFKYDFGDDEWQFKESGVGNNYRSIGEIGIFGPDYGEEIGEKLEDKNRDKGMKYFRNYCEDNDYYITSKVQD